MDTHRAVAVDSNLGAQPFQNTAVAGLVLVAAGITGRPRVLYSIDAFNLSTGSNPAFLQLFNAPSTASVTLGTTVPALQFVLPASGRVTLELAGDIGAQFNQGIVVACTTTASGATPVTVGVGLNLVWA